MFSAKLAVSRQLTSVSARAFGGRVPSIRFIGKRQQFNKHLGVFDQGAAASAAFESAPVGDKKTVSPMSELTFADEPADRWARLPFSAEEIQVINQGTNDIDLDWRSIKL